MWNEVLAAYDVEDNKTRFKLSEKLRDMGLVHIQKSVMWGFLRAPEENAVCRLFDEMLNEATDRAFIVRVNLKNNLRERAFNTPDSLFHHPDESEVL